MKFLNTIREHANCGRADQPLLDAALAEAAEAADILQDLLIHHSMGWELDEHLARAHDFVRRNQ